MAQSSFQQLDFDRSLLTLLIIKITISWIVIGLKKLLFSTNSLAKFVIGQFVIGQFNKQILISMIKRNFWQSVKKSAHRVRATLQL